MRYAIACVLALCLLLTGCGVQTAQPGAFGTGTAIVHSASLPSNPSGTPSTPTCRKLETPVDMTRMFQRTASVESGRGSSAKTLSGKGVDEVLIYAELCTLVLEQSATDNLEVFFSYPEITATNYVNHFKLVALKTDGVATVSTEYENGRWDTAFEPISGFDGNGYRESAILTVKLPKQPYSRVNIHLVTPGSTLDISGVDTVAMEVRIGTGDVVICTDRVYPNISIEHVVGNVTLYTPELGEHLQISSKIGVFTLSLPTEPDNFSLEIRYDEEAITLGDEAVYVLPISWNAIASGHTVRYGRGNGEKSIVVGNHIYGVFAVEIDGVPIGEPASAQ